MERPLSRAFAQLDQVLIGKSHQLKLALSCLLAGGHLLLEDLPGMGKTTLSSALAHTLGLSYSRVQFTADMLPADLLGVSIFNPSKQVFTFHSGPIFCQVLLADEINRASPKTQSALLEAMAENQVSIDGDTYPLPTPFFVIATQNPQEQAGTFSLPESQIDRFMMRLSLGFPSLEAEKQILKGDHRADDLDQLEVQLDHNELALLQQMARQVSVSEPVLDYILDLVSFSRHDELNCSPLSPRASRALLAAARAWALISARNYLIPDDVQAVFASVTEHRLRAGLYTDGSLISEAILGQINPIR